MNDHDAITLADLALLTREVCELICRGYRDLADGNHLLYAQTGDLHYQRLATYCESRSTLFSGGAL